MLLGEFVLDINVVFLFFIHLIQHFMHLGIVLESVSVSQSVQTVVC
jgi:hypothetical protein